MLMKVIISVLAAVGSLQVPLQNHKEKTLPFINRPFIVDSAQYTFDG